MEYDGDELGEWIRLRQGHLDDSESNGDESFGELFCHYPGVLKYFLLTSKRWDWRCSYH